MQGAPRKSTRGRYGPPFLPPPSLSSPNSAALLVNASRRTETTVHPRVQCEQFSRLSPPWNLYATRYISFRRLVWPSLISPVPVAGFPERNTCYYADRIAIISSPRIREYLNSIRWGLMNCLNAIIFVYTIWLQKE